MATSFDAVDAVRLGFLSATSAVLFTYLIPSLNARFLQYGARSVGQKDGAQSSDSGLTRLLDQAASVKVPHSWFISFYMVSTALSLFWLVVIPIFHAQLTDLAPILDLDRPSPPFSRTQLAALLMLIQGIRRLIESYTLPVSSSTMWIGHWLVGIGFYCGMSVAIWIEGVPALVKHRFTIHDLEFVAPSLRSALCLFVFLFASGIQHDCHSYLASLKSKSQGRYQMPDFPAFSFTLTPHYFMECLIYLSLALLTAPEGRWLNDTITCAVIFVVTNLGVTALGTRKWYEAKFGKKAVAGKWAMIPLLL